MTEEISSEIENSNIYIKVENGTNSDQEEENEGEEANLARPKRRKRIPQFNRDWLLMPVFEDWLTEGVEPEFAFCLYCDLNLCAQKPKLLRHAQSAKHIMNSNYGNITSKSKSNDDKEQQCDGVATDDSSVLKVIDLRSDSLASPSSGMRMAMAKSKMGDVAFNTDEATVELEESVAKILDKEAGLFFPTHVMANLVAVLTHCQSRGSTLFAGVESDIFKNNREALIKFGGVNFCSIEERDDGTFCLDEMESLLKTVDVNPPLSCLVCFECPHARRGGIVPHFNWIKGLGGLKTLFPELLIHCDGTRLINASLYRNCQPCDFISDCDSATFALDKGYGAPLGAVLVGSFSFIERASYIRLFLGGQLHQAGIFASAGTFALKRNLGQLEVDHERALLIAQAISHEKSSAVVVDIENVHTNIVLLHCLHRQLTAPKLKSRLEMVMNDKECENTDGVRVVLLTEVIDETTLSLSLHSGISLKDVDAVISKIRYVIRENKKTK